MRNWPLEVERRSAIPEATGSEPHKTVAGNDFRVERVIEVGQPGEVVARYASHPKTSSLKTAGLTARSTMTGPWSLNLRTSSVSHTNALVT
jgi:hypothetical protein